ncbi:MAG: class IV adenylate cyclase [Desulfovibrionaceae bacterium]
MALECERKYLGIDFASVRTALKEHHAVCEGIHIESNSLWDTPHRRLRPQGTLLRLRTQQWYASGNNCAACKGRTYILTLKMVATEQQGCKIREECEVVVDDVAIMESILRGLGYEITARYEKVREVWHMHNAELALDILPFGHFMEVEGTVEAIEYVAKLVHIERALQSTESYHRLHQEWRSAQGLEPCIDFVFEPAQKAELVRYIQELSL